MGRFPLGMHSELIENRLDFIFDSPYIQTFGSFTASSHPGGLKVTKI